MTNRRELADRLEDNADWLRDFPTRSIIDNKLSGVDGRGIDSVEVILREAARLLREPVAGEVLEALESLFAHTSGINLPATAHIMRARAQSAIRRARLDDEGKGGA